MFVQLLKTSTLAKAAACVSALSVAQTSANMRWRMASSFLKSLDTIEGAAEVLAKRVSAITCGKFLYLCTLRVYLFPLWVAKSQRGWVPRQCNCRVARFAKHWKTAP